MGLPIVTESGTIELIGGGRLLAWLGPALRGTLAWAVKQTFCRWAPAERDTHYRTRKPCPHVAQCVYGCTFESEPLNPSSNPSGMADGQRSITLRPFFPTPEHGEPGVRTPLWITFVGERAIAAAEPIRRLLAQPGRTFALGEDRVEFRLIARSAGSRFSTAVGRLEPEDLPGGPEDAPGRLPSVGVELLGPLFLKEEGTGSRDAKRPVFEPTFGQLLRASLRTVGRALAEIEPGRLDGRVDFAALKARAESVPAWACSWRRFEQRHRSNRRGQAYLVRGVVGSAVYRDVPRCLVPRLVWGGRLGVGEHRVAGAGAWRVRLSG